MQDIETRASTRPVAAGLFEGQGALARLLGSRCSGCGSVYFPVTLGCRNPGCSDKRLETARLSRRGTLYSYTVQAYRPPPLFRMDDWSPYAIGLVDLPEGLRVMGMLGGCDPHDWRIGQAVALSTALLYRDDQGQDVLTYQFHPAGEGAGS